MYQEIPFSFVRQRQSHFEDQSFGFFFNKFSKLLAELFKEIN